MKSKAIKLDELSSIAVAEGFRKIYQSDYSAKFECKPPLGGVKKVVSFEVYPRTKNRAGMISCGEHSTPFMNVTEFRKHVQSLKA